MHLSFPPAFATILLSFCACSFACSSATVVNNDPSGGGGISGDALGINLDANRINVPDAMRGTNSNSDTPPGPNCGNGVLTKDEACDDGNTVSGDGCAHNCLNVETGYVCVTPGKPCRPIARCGDGLAVFPEQCDDGNKVDGDGCSADCRIEIGYKCEGSPSVCTHTTCGDHKIEGAEGCEDGNAMPFDGCSADCTNEPTCTGTGGCSSRCGDGIVIGSEACDDGNNTDGDGCSADCKVEAGFTCSQPSLGAKMLVPAIYRDFRFYNPSEFQANDVTGWTDSSPGMVKSDLDADGKPVYTGLTGGAIKVQSADTFAKWYRNVDGVNHATTGKLPLWNNGAGAYVNRWKDDGTQWYSTENAYYCGGVGSEQTDTDGNAIPCTSKFGTTDCDKEKAAGKEMLSGSCTVSNGGYSAKFVLSTMDGNPLFFPVDNDTFSPASERNAAAVPSLYDSTGSWSGEVDASGNKVLHNFSFTTEVRYWFKYDSSKTYVLSFLGDDDVWVFINKKLAVDLGGIHTPIEGSVTLDSSSASKLGLANGNVYEIAVFQAERQMYGSSYKLTLSGFNAAPSVCKANCGDGILEIGEECDDGTANGTRGYGTCGSNCTLQAGYCGDGIKQVDDGEECDDGSNNGLDGYCPTGCHYLIPIL